MSPIMRLQTRYMPESYGAFRRFPIQILVPKLSYHTTSFCWRTVSIPNLATIHLCLYICSVLWHFDIQIITLHDGIPAWRRRVSR